MASVPEVTFGSLDSQLIQGGEFTLSRGVTPSSARIFLDPVPALSQIVGTLRFAHEGRAVEFRDAALAPQTLRMNKGRDWQIWSVQVMDRRWKWRYTRVSGTFNQRACDGRIIADTRLDLLALLRHVLGAMGEHDAILENIPAGIFPMVAWDESRADLELAHLCEQHGLIPWLGIDNRAHVAPLGSGAGLDESDDDIIPHLRLQQAVRPAAVQVKGGPVVFQAPMQLRAVGMDTDGTVRPIDQLSYAPADGWERCWYTTFSEVPIAVRHLAFQSVWRWYEPIVDSISVSVPVSSLNQLVLHHSLAEAPVGDDGTIRCAPPIVTGTFWPQSDHASNAVDATYSGDFWIDSERRLVKFEYPVVYLGADGLAEPSLELLTAFSVTGSDGLARASAIRSIGGQGPMRVDVRSSVRTVENASPVYESSEAEPDNDLDAIAQAIANGHQGLWAKEVALEGIRQLDLTGKIAQVRWVCGVHDSRPATTRASENMEFDVFVPHHQERRRRERGNQVADRMLR